MADASARKLAEDVVEKPGETWVAETPLKAGAIGLAGAVMQNVTNIAPAVAAKSRQRAPGSRSPTLARYTRNGTGISASSTPLTRSCRSQRKLGSSRPPWRLPGS